MNKKYLSMMAVLLALIVAACSPRSPAPSSPPSYPGYPNAETLPITAASPEEAGLIPLEVEQVEVQVGVGSPIPVEIVVSGLWPSRCSQFADVKTEIDGFTIDVALLASIVEPCPPDQAGLSFRFALPLNMVELPEGLYTITVNGTSTTFEWPQETDPTTGSISGWVWQDECITGRDGEPAPTSTPPGCVEEDSALGPYHANGVLDEEEVPIEGVRVELRQGECTNTSLAGIKDEVITIAADLSYTFTGVPAGTYCVSIDPQEEPNFSTLRPGMWTYPFVSQDTMAQTITLAPGENKHDVNFGWDYQFQ